MIRRELKMFKKDNRYVTRGINEEVDIRLQLIMWSMIDKLKNEGNVEVNNRKLIDLKKLQQELNYIQFTLIEEFNKVVELCNGTGYDKEILVYIELEEGKYVIKLIPVKDSYSYIYTYKRQEEKVMDIVTVIKVVGTILTVVATSIEATTKKQ